MNRVFRIVWNRSKRLWVVVSELAYRSRACLRVRPATKRLPQRWLATALTLLMATAGRDAIAQTVINSSTSRQIITGSSSYVLPLGNTATTSGGEQALRIDGLSGFTFSIAGTVRGTTIGGWSAFDATVPGTVTVQSTGLVYGTTFGILMEGSGANHNVINYGDITASASHPIYYGTNASGTVDNYAKINGGVAGTVGPTPNGITVATEGSLVVNNHAGGTIFGGASSPTYGNGIDIQTACNCTVNNAGNIAVNNAAVYTVNTGAKVSVSNLAGGNLTGNLKPVVGLVNNSTVRNAGTINGSAEAITFTGSGNTVILESTSSITGTVNGGTNGTFVLGGASGSGVFDLGALGAGLQYRNFTTFEKREAGTWVTAWWPVRTNTCCSRVA